MKKQIMKRLLDYKVVQEDDILKNSLEGIVYNDTKHNIKAGLVKPLAYMHRNILDHRDIFNSLFKIEPMKGKQISDFVQFLGKTHVNTQNKKGKLSLLQIHSELKIRIIIRII